MPQKTTNFVGSKLSELDTSMKLKYIDISNVLCYKQFHVDLVNGTNVFIGRNGSGKTSLIKSIVYALNFIMSNDKSLGGDFVTSGNPDLRLRSVGIDEFYRPNGSEVSPDCCIAGCIDVDGEDVKWEMYKRATAKSEPYPTKYRDAYNAFIANYKTTGKLPLLAYYSDSYPHVAATYSQFASNEIGRSGNILRNMGYYKWSDETACLDLWRNRYVNSVIRSLSDNVISPEINFVETCIKTFTSSNDNDTIFDAYTVKDLEVYYPVNGKLPMLRLVMSNGRRSAFEELPSGYRRLYSIVFDIAYRIWILNPQKPAETSGVVIIDEVDLHLHPALSTIVMEQYHKTFPNVQFIVSTHSPMIVSSLNTSNGENQIIDLSRHSQQAQVIPDTYGLSYDVVVEDFMGVKSSSEEQIEFLKNVIRRANRRGRRNIAEPKKRELRSIVSEERYNQIMQELALESE